MQYRADLPTISKRKSYRMSDVKDKIEKVAFDVVRFRDDSEDQDFNLWKIEATTDGPVIVAMYADEVPSSMLEVKTASVNNPWSALTDSRANINIYYKGEPIKVIASVDDAKFVCGWLPEKLATDDSFRKSLLEDLSDTDRAMILSKYPEIVRG